MAKSHQSLDDIVLSHKYYREVADASQEEISAESLFRIAQLYFEENKLDSAENVIFELAKHVPTYPRWLAEGLILLSDIHVIAQDYFQARTTLESIIANYTEDQSILRRANKKLERIIEIEAAEFNASPIDQDMDQDMELDLELESLQNEQDALGKTKKIKNRKKGESKKKKKKH